MTDTADPLARLDPEQRALCLAARTAQDPNARDRLAGSIAEGLDWERLWDLAHLHEVVPLVGAMMLAVGGDTVPAAWRIRTTRRRHVTLRANGRLADTLFEVLAALDAAGVPAMPVKGLVIADELYGDVAARPCADLDVLVRPADLARARAVLADRGFAQRAAPRYKALVHQFHDPAWGRGIGADHIRLELHWALWADSDRRLGATGLWDRSRTTTLLDRPIRTLSLEDTLLHLAIHRTRSALRLRWVVDIAELLRRHAATLDWDAYLDRARVAGARTSSWMVLSLAHDLLDGPVPAAVLRALDVGGPKRLLLERTCGARALFRAAPSGDLRQQPHLILRAFEEDGPARIASVFGGGITRPIRETLHDTGLVRARRRMA